ncbi:type II toxin-antitoxin system HipA family toxin [Leucothrix arctica]|uniref:type II toxin-antitoxin system HipA family toxin n=1 Tax=Leucothrix arctica TaxID=1481894 RepID=UPI001BA7EC06|nr:type II toxin-antitoxin system HipA family toxin [Leucothrix arctica]
MVKTLTVLMNGLLIGHLRKSSEGGMSFRYDESWLTTPDKRPISMHLPTEPALHTGDQVYNFFDNLLPDNPAIRTHIQQRFAVRSNHPFDLLEAIGKDCIGAIQLYRSDETPHLLRAIVGTPLSEDDLKQKVASSRTAPLGMTPSHEDFRISLAGAQDKTGFLWHDNQWQTPEGTTPTTHIIKLPIGKIDHNSIDLTDSVDNEWLCLNILRLYGLDITNADRLTIADTTVLAVERFDRRLSRDKSWIMRLPQEDMCQALGYSSGQKYQADGGPGMVEIMKLLERSDNAEKDRHDFMKINFLFWLMCAPDGHAKNFSIFILQGGKFKMTPFYDVLSLYPLMANRQINQRDIKMAMGLKGSKQYYNWYGPSLTIDHVLSTADQCGFSRDIMYDIVKTALAQTEEVIQKAEQLIPSDLSRDVSNSIFDGMRTTAARLEKQL